MTEKPTPTLADYVELALKRREVDSGRRLADIAFADGFRVSHSTLNRIRRGNYHSEVTTHTLKAIAHLAREPYDAVFAAASQKSDGNWAELEKTFFEWSAAVERVTNFTVRYARLRGITVAEASEELNDMAQQFEDFRAGRASWYPPWDPATDEDRARDAAYSSSNDAKSDPLVGLGREFSADKVEHGNDSGEKFG